MRFKIIFYTVTFFVFLTKINAEESPQDMTTALRAHKATRFYNELYLVPDLLPLNPPYSSGMNCIHEIVNHPIMMMINNLNMCLFYLKDKDYDNCINELISCNFELKLFINEVIKLQESQ